MGRQVYIWVKRKAINTHNVIYVQQERRIGMKHKIGDTVEIFKIKEKTKVVSIVKGVQADIYGTMINAYELEGRKKLYVDIHDGTVGSI